MAVAELDWVEAAELCPLDPTDDYVVIAPQEGEDRTPGGIVLPDQAIAKPSRGRVLAVGPGKRDGKERVELGVAIGDLVIFGKYSGSEVEVAGETFLIVREGDIIAKVRDLTKGP